MKWESQRKMKICHLHQKSHCRINSSSGVIRVGASHPPPRTMAAVADNENVTVHCELATEEVV